MKLRKLIRILHRDFGYFIVGMTIVYALSGILLNHKHDFNPDYKIFNSEFKVNLNKTSGFSEMDVKNALKTLDREVVFKKHYINNQGYLKVFIENGEVLINPQNGEGIMHYLQRRPVFFEMNKLHKSTLGVLWKWVSDAMAVFMMFVAITGLVLLKGKRGFGRWGWWLTIAGIVIPLFFVIMNIN